MCGIVGFLNFGLGESLDKDGEFVHLFEKQSREIRDDIGDEDVGLIEDRNESTFFCVAGKINFFDYTLFEFFDRRTVSTYLEKCR